jgi:putative serine protease PepD
MPATVQPSMQPSMQPSLQAPIQPSMQGRRRSLFSVVAIATAAALVAGVLGGLASSWFVDGSRSTSLADPPAALPSVSVPAAGASGAASAGAVVPGQARPANSVAGVAARVLPSIVAIKVTGQSGAGTGSGFVIDGKGHILTNNHVVAAAGDGGSIKVVFDDGSQKDATVVGKDASYDLAVIKTDVGSRPALVLGNSDQAVVGDLVIAIGAPLGLQGTVTTGIISAKNRPVAAGEDATQPSFINAIQTDAAINPGNSGGPLVDAAGNVIGVNSAIARAPGSTGTTGGNIGVGFAIPSNQARRTASELISNGKAQHPILGISLDQRYDGEGVRVADAPSAAGEEPVRPGGPAAKAGIKPGDVVTAIDGRPVTTPDELIVAVRAKEVGGVAVLTVRRAGQELKISVTLAAATG